MSSFIVSLFWFLLFVGGAIYLAYQRIDLRTSTIAAGLAVLAYTIFGEGSFLWKLVLWAAFGAMIVPNLIEFRREKITKPLLDVYRKMLPSMSDTEREALEAGNVWWEGELFSGMPEWDRLMSYPAPKLSEEEQAFLDGPCEELCRMIDDWEICHERADMPKEVWDYIIEQKFFAMIIPKQYGGLEFSAYANACVIMKLASRSATASSTIGVPNSLGPAELLLHYGTDEQKDRYLPGLAAGKEIPCFALTSPQAGSDAASIIDSGVVCKGEWEGETIVGIRLNWDKRYITLAPIATVLGLAFKLYDPDHLIGDKDEYGITAALIPTDTPGVTVGRRHHPLTIGFQNGPTSGKDVFVPTRLHHRRPGDGRQGLEDAGRAAVRRPRDHAAVDRGRRRPGSELRDRRIRHASQAVQYLDRQFRRRRRGADPNRRLQLHHECRRIGDLRCDRPGREAGGTVRDSQVPLHRAGPQGQQRRDGRARRQGHLLGPNNYLGRGFMATPIAITVEGANILTRSLIIYGQGAIRCHPFVLRELAAAGDEDIDRGLIEFDDALFGHIGYAISNVARSFFLALTHAKFSKVPLNTPTRRYYQNINRYSAAFALASDFAMLTLGGDLKKRELLSARLGDVLSSMYLASCVLKHFENQGRRATDLPLVEWSVRTLMYQAQEALHSFLQEPAEPLGGDIPAHFHLPARPHLLRTIRRSRAQGRGAGDRAWRGARAAERTGLHDRRARQPHRTVGGSAAAEHRTRPAGAQAAAGLQGRAHQRRVPRARRSTKRQTPRSSTRTRPRNCAITMTRCSRCSPSTTLRRRISGGRPAEQAETGARQSRRRKPPSASRRRERRSPAEKGRPQEKHRHRIGTDDSSLRAHL